MSPSNPLHLHLAVQLAALFNDDCNSSSESTKGWSSQGVQCPWLTLTAALGDHQAFAKVLCRDKEQLHQASIFFSCALLFVKRLVKIGKSKSKGRLKVQQNYCYGLQGFGLWGMLIKGKNLGSMLFCTSRVSLSSSILLSLEEKNRAHLRPEFGFLSSDTAKSFLASNE